MSEDLIRQVNRIQDNVDGLIKPEKSTRLTAAFDDLPGKVGIWYAGDAQRSTGDIYDRSNQGRLLTYNGNPVSGQLTNGIAYAALDGTGDFFSRADETDLDVLGTETIYGSGVRGLTIGGWFWYNALGSSETLISKWGAAGQRSYMIDKRNTENVRFVITNDGSTNEQVLLSTGVSNNTWLYCVGRFIPSTEVAVFVNNESNTNTVGISAAVFNSNNQLNIGATVAGSALLTGRYSIAFLCANALPDSMIQSIFQQTRVLFGV